MAAEDKASAGEKDAAYAAMIASAVAKAVAESTAAIQEKLHPTEKREPSLISPFNPDGRKVRPKLNARYIFCGAELRADQMTNDEIEVMNKISKAGDYHKNQWHVRVKLDDSGKHTILIDLPVKTLDQRMEMPNSLIAIVQEILAEEASKAKATVKA